MGGKYIKHRKAYTLIVMLSIILIVYVVLIISHKIERNRISNKPGTTLNMISDDVEYQEYNVDGMTEEEIKEYLDIIRSGENETDE